MTASAPAPVLSANQQPGKSIAAFGNSNGFQPSHIDVQTVARFITLFDTSSTDGTPVTITSRDGSVFVIAMQCRSALCFPTAYLQSFDMTGNTYFLYSDDPIFQSAGFPAPNFRQFTGGSCPTYGVWCFTAHVATAAVALDVNGVPTFPAGLNAAPATVGNYYYQVAVAKATNYTVTLGTVAEGYVRQ